MFFEQVLNYVLYQIRSFLIRTPKKRSLPKRLKAILQDFPNQRDIPQNHTIETLASSNNHMKKTKLVKKQQKIKQKVELTIITKQIITYNN